MCQIARTSAIALTLVVASASQACSVCIAHAIGAGLRTFGAQGLGKGKLTFGLSTLNFAKSNAGEEGDERHEHSETSLELQYGLSNQLTLRGQLPYVDKSIQVDSAPKEGVKGFGDASIGASYQLVPRPSDPFVLAFALDLKLPTGRNRMTDGESLREEHLQLGTGSTDLSLSVLATRDLGHGSLGFASVGGRMNGRNGRGNRYGNVLFYNVGATWNLTAESSIVAEWNGRFAAKDRVPEGGHDENSGGHVAYASLSFRQSVGQVGLFATYQLPVIKNLNGTQRESRILSFGLSGSL